MEPKKSRRRITRAKVIETVSAMLDAVLDNGDDLILTYEMYPDNDRQNLHVLTGKLISPCMLGTLKNKAEIREEEGSKLVTLRWK